MELEVQQIQVKVSFFKKIVLHIKAASMVNENLKSNCWWWSCDSCVGWRYFILSVTQEFQIISEKLKMIFPK